MSAKQRYDRLSSDRSQFHNVARQAAELTLPYLVREDEAYTKGAKKLITPWQSVGAKGVVTLASKLMLALLPPCLLYTSPSPRDRQKSRMPSSA